MFPSLHLFLYSYQRISGYHISAFHVTVIFNVIQPTSNFVIISYVIFGLCSPPLSYEADAQTCCYLPMPWENHAVALHSLSSCLPLLPLRPPQCLTRSSHSQSKDRPTQCPRFFAARPRPGRSSGGAAASSRDAWRLFLSSLLATAT